MTRSTRFLCFFTAQTSIFQQHFVNFIGVAKKVTLISNFVAILPILMKFARIFSDFVENAEKRCFSKFVDFNLTFIMIIPEIYCAEKRVTIFNYRLNFRFNFHRPPIIPEIYRAEKKELFNFRLNLHFSFHRPPYPLSQDHAAPKCTNLICHPDVFQTAFRKHHVVPCTIKGPY